MDAFRVITPGAVLEAKFARVALSRRRLRRPAVAGTLASGLTARRWTQ